MDLPADRAAHRGCFDAAMARAAGWSRAQRDTAVRRGELVVVRHGVYQPTDEHEALDARGRHLGLIAAEQLALGRHWHAARRSAAVVYELPLIGRPPVEAQLLADASGTRSRGYLRHRRIAPLTGFDAGTCDGMAVVSPARAVCDIARAEAFRNAVVVADAALRRGLPRVALEQCLAGMCRWPGVEQARDAVAFADARSESPLESLSRCSCHVLGIEPPELQVEIWLGADFLGRADFLWRRYNTVGEADGLDKYGSTDGERLLSFAAQKRRTEQMEDVGLEVCHWGWDEAWRPRDVLDARLRRAFARGSVQALDPRVRFVPAQHSAALVA